MAKKNYDQMAEQILALVGGKENITFFVHCVTRLRFNVRDKSLVQVKEIENVNGVVGSQWSGEQYQVIIGQDVEDVYSRICKNANIKAEAAIDENLDSPVKEKFSIKKLPSILAEIITGSITPFIPVLIGAGMIKVILLLLSTFNMINVEGSTYTVLSLVADCGFYFLPVFVGKGAAKKFGADEGLGMLIALALVCPSFVSLVDGGAPITVFGLPIYAGYYMYLVFPVILCCAVMAPIQKFFRKISPSMLTCIIEPTGTLLVMIPLAFCLLAPLGSIIGTYVANALIWLYETFGAVGLAIFSALYPLLVVTGMHNATTPYWIECFENLGYEPLVSPADCLNNVNQGVAALAVSVKSKKESLKSLGATAGITAVVAGISEPSLFGVNLKYKTPLIAAMCGNFVGGLICGIMKVHCYTIYGTGGLFATPCYVGPTATNFIGWIIALAAGAVVTFVVSYILHKDVD